MINANSKVEKLTILNGNKLIMKNAVNKQIRGFITHSRYLNFIFAFFNIFSILITPFIYSLV